MGSRIWEQRQSWDPTCVAVASTFAPEIYAVELISAAIAQNDQVPSFHNNLANALNAQGKLPEAAASYGRALALVHDDAERRLLEQRLGDLSPR